MKYLRITNAGCLDPMFIALMGASTKRNKDKIGKFGTGLKYAVAWLMRNNYSVRLHVDGQPVSIKSVDVQAGDQTYGVITINDTHTSITTDMGPDWVGWMIVRELYCNAMDEGDYSISVVDETESGAVPGKTVWDIQLTGEVLETWKNIDQYFIPQSKMIAESNNIKYYPPAECLAKDAILLAKETIKQLDQ